MLFPGLLGILRLGPNARSVAGNRKQTPVMVCDWCLAWRACLSWQDHDVDCIAGSQAPFLHYPGELTDELGNAPANSGKSYERVTVP